MTGTRTFADGTFTDTDCSVVDGSVLDALAVADDVGSPISCAGYFAEEAFVVAVDVGVGYTVSPIRTAGWH